MSSKLEIEYPENLPDVLQTTRARFEQEVKMAMAVKLFEMRRLSSGMAAALVGMDRVSFLLRLSDFGVSMIDLDADELAVACCVQPPACTLVQGKGSVHLVAMIGQQPLYAVKGVGGLFAASQDQFQAAPGFEA